jgi:hypothetical protein
MMPSPLMEQVMQYAVMDSPNLPRPIILDANEYLHITNAKYPREEVPGTNARTARVPRLVYGMLLWARPKDDYTEEYAQHVIEFFQQMRGVEFATITYDSRVQWSNVADFELFPCPGMAGRAGMIALIKTSLEIPAKSFGITMFPRREDIDILSDVLNRPGLFCAKREDVRARKKLAGCDGACWRQFIDWGRARRVAESF